MICRSAFLIVTAALVAAAQEGHSRSEFYGFFSGGACIHGYDVWGGGAGGQYVSRWATLGVETTVQQFRGDVAFGTLTPQVGFNFNRTRKGAWDPFVTAGAGIGFASGAATVANLGGGVTYWFKPRIGLRLEYRLVILTPEEGINTFRVGLSFR